MCVVRIPRPGLWRENAGWAWLWILIIALAISQGGPAASIGQEPDALHAAMAMEKMLVDAITRSEKSVVAIARVRKGSRNAQNGIALDNRFPFRQPQLGLAESSPTSPDFIPNEFATGVVIDREGHILTNYHVLGNPEENDYFVWSQRRPFQVSHVERPEKIEAGDPWTDLAVLTIPAQGLQPISLGDAAKLRKGMIVIALGNPYGIARDGQASASWGIVSNLRRSATSVGGSTRPNSSQESVHQFGTLIQTDARLNLGTSGGALLNLKGEMVGLITSLAALSGYEQPAGFAIPVNAAFRKTVETLKQGRLPAFGFLGVQPDDLTVAERQQGRLGARVLRVVPGTPADTAGVRPNDIITHVAGTQVADKNALFRELSSLPAESKVELTLQRKDPLRQRRRAKTVSVALSKKYIGSARRPYARLSDEPWRGLRVEFPSALPPQLNLQGRQAADGQGCVAVLEVLRDSPAWKAGLRRGEFISHVGNRRVAVPREFRQAVAGQTGDVRLHVITPAGDTKVLVVSR